MYHLFGSWALVDVGRSLIGLYAYVAPRRGWPFFFTFDFSQLKVRSGATCITWEILCITVVRMSDVSSRMGWSALVVISFLACHYTFEHFYKLDGGSGIVQRDLIQEI